MTRSSRAWALVLTVASALSLSACAPTPAQPPPAASDAQLKTMMGSWPSIVVSLYNHGSPNRLEDVSFVRFASDAEWPKLMTRCAAEYGVFDITFHPDHTTSAPAISTLGQWDRDFAYSACTIKYPPASVRGQLKTPQQLDFIYSYYSNELVPCLRAEGVEVTGMPTRDVFHVASANGFRMWNPYNAVEARLRTLKTVMTSAGVTGVPDDKRMSDLRFQVLQSKCPRFPPGVDAG